MKQITVTGGAGFIGSNLAHHYLSEGHRVVIYDTLERNGSFENVRWLQSHSNSESFKLLVGDVRLPTRQLREEIERSDAVFHFAAQVAVTTSVADPVHDFEVNALGTFKLLELVRESSGKRPAFFYSSTNKVYGGMQEVVIEEDDARYYYRDFPEGIPEDRVLDFHSPYGCSNGAADQYVRDYSRMYALKTVVFRQSCIYGYRQFGLEDQGWLAWFIIAAILGRQITIFGDGKQVRDVLFIDDLVGAYDQAWGCIDEINGRIYNIGGGAKNAISLRELLAVIKEEIDPDLPLNYSDWRPGDQPVYISDIHKAKGDFGWEPRVDWNTGVHRLIDWVRENKNMLETLF